MQTSGIRQLGIVLLVLLAGMVRADSLWTEGTGALYTEHRAHAVGDLLTVIITVDSSTSTAARHNTAKSVDVDAGGGTGWFKGFTGLGVKADRTTNGTGASSNVTSVDDHITVMVIEVLPNGVLRIEGSRLIRLGKDDMSMTFSGLVRPEDVGPDNMIYSVMVADQRLDSKGKGPIGEKQKPGLISRLLSFLW